MTKTYLRFHGQVEDINLFHSRWKIDKIIASCWEFTEGLELKWTTIWYAPKSCPFWDAAKPIFYKILKYETNLM
jgi:hypothetical protein